MEPNSLATIPGMGIPEQLKAAMEQEQTSKTHTHSLSLFLNVISCCIKLALYIMNTVMNLWPFLHY